MSLNMLKAMYLQDTKGFIVVETVDGQLIGKSSDDNGTTTPNKPNSHLS